MSDIVDLVLDPGHGGRDPGALGPTTKEKDNTLKLANKVAAILTGSGRFRVHFTRTDDRDFCSGNWTESADLINRVNIANAYGGKAYISFHDNSATVKAYGNEVYAVAPGGDGEKLAKAICTRMAAQLGMVDRGVKFAGWYVCKWTDMPAVLVEYGFINTEEDTILAKMDQAALAIAQGIGDIFGISVNDVKEASDVLKDAIVIFTPNDYWALDGLNAKFDNQLPVFNRGGRPGAPAAAMSAEHVFNVGGPALGHPNETWISGKDKYETAAKMGEWLATH